MSNAKVIFGLRDFPRPREWGFLFCKLSPYYRELPLIDLNLYETQSTDLKDLFTKGIKKLTKLDNFQDNHNLSQLHDYDTENMQEWSNDILNDVIKTLNPEQQ